MVETLQGYENWLQEFRTLTESDNIILHVIPPNDDDHPVVVDPIILFVKHLTTDKTFTFSFYHQDSSCSVKMDTVFKEMRESRCNKWVFDRKAFVEITGFGDVYDVNLLLYSSSSKLIEMYEFETQAHMFIKRSHGVGEINKVVPLMKHLEMFEELSQSMRRVIKKYYNPKDDSFKFFNFTVLDVLIGLEVNGLCVDPEKFKEKFGARIYSNNMVYSQYNIFTATGRPSCRYAGVNYAALNKDDGSRECFVSRFRGGGNDGKLFLVDYSSFHPNLICHIVGYDLPEGKEVYEYLGEMYFNRKNLSEFDIAEAKTITFRQLYGGVEDKYQHIKYFVRLKEYINGKWEEFQKNGFIYTPWWKRKIDGNHLKDPNPNKLFNYILQAAELEFAGPVIMKLNDYFKPRKSKVILYTYDSLLFDISADESREVIPHIINVMSRDGRMPVKSYIGNDYDSMRQVII